MKKYLALIILCSILNSGCVSHIKEKVRNRYLDAHTAGFIHGLECAEKAIEMGYPVSYCYEVLKDLNNKIRKEAL